MYNQQKRPIRKTGRPWLELGVEDVPSNIARTKGRPAVGVLVTGLHSKAALEAGLKNGDIIVAINHRVVYNQKELFSFIERESKPYDVVMLRVIRDDEGMDIPMKLGSTGKESKIRQEVQESIPVITLKCPYCGVDVSNVSETCPQCGKELWFPNQKGNATYPKKSKKKSISSHGLLSEKPIAYKIKRAVVSLSGKIYSNPDITSSAISKIQEDEKVIILEESGEFYKVRLEANSEVTGYLEKDLFASKWAVVSLNGPMFAEPDIASSPVCEVFKGDKLIILDETEKYCHVKLETERSISGYITKELLGPIERRESKTSDIVAYQSTNPMTSIHSTIKNDQASQPKQSDAAVYKALKRKHAEAKEDFSRLRLSRGLIGFFLGLVFVVLAFVNFFFKVNNNPFLSWSELQSTVFYSIILIIIGLVIAIIIGAPVREAGKRVKELNQRLRDYEQKQALGYNSSGVVRTASVKVGSSNTGWSTFGNVMWVVFGGGLSTCLEYVLAGIASCITLIGIPFGIQYFKLAGLVISPFGKEVVTEKEGCLMTGMNILWIFTVGLTVTLTHLFWGILLTITIIGFPFAKQHFKLMVLSFTPFGKRVQ